MEDSLNGGYLDSELGFPPFIISPFILHLEIDRYIKN
jgi:hypothetical protein